MSDSYDGTDLDTFYDSTPAWSGTAETDVIYRSNEGDFAGTPYIGYTWCDNYQGTTSNIYDCDQHYINFKFRHTTTRSLACHETGHSVGLTHGEDANPETDDLAVVLGCMRRPNYSANKYLAGNNVIQIDALY